MDTNDTTRPLARNRTRQTLAPSHPDFDRSAISDNEYIELLLFENKELASVVVQREKTIASLEEKLRAVSIASVDDGAKPSTNEDNGNGKANNDSTADDTDTKECAEIPLRSARRRRNSIRTEVSPTPDKKTRPGLEESETSNAKNNEPSEADDNGVADKSSLPETPAPELSRGISAASGISALSGISGSSLSGTTSAPEKHDKVKHDDNSTLNESIITVDSEHYSVNDSLGNIKNADPPIYREQSNDSSKLSETKVYSDNKYSQSSSSFSSYKSRIKLPPTLQQQMKKQTSTSHFQEPASPKTAREGDSTPQTYLKSPALFNPNDIHHDAKTVPRTPDAFSSGKFPVRMENTDDSHSYISSPIQGSLRHSQMSPDRSIYKSSYDSGALKSPLNGYISTESIGTPRPSAQTPGSSFHVLNTPKLDEDDTALLIKPEEFHTIYVTVASTINISQNKRNDDPNCTFSISDRDSNKEMWRIRKTYSQLVAFDNEIRPIVEYFGLPALPEKILFSSSSPGKIELRRVTLQNYFNTLFVMPHIPQMVLYRICRYLSLDFVNPLDDYKSGARKKGFLIRRYKGLGTSWKVRWCQVDGPFLEVYEVPGGAVLEQIKLRGSLIGRQSNDSVAEDKGYRHALLIMEPQKPKLTSSYAKHFFCAESDEERDDWVEALLEFNDSFSAGHAEETSIPPESPIPSKYEYQEDQTPSLTYTTASHSNDQISSTTIISDEKDLKKTKKRSYFPFRNKMNGVNLGTLLSSENVLDIDANSIPPPQTPQDGSMQHYLDQLNLDEDLTKRIFGRDIEDAFALSNGDFMGRQIPSICLRCLDFLIKTRAIYEEGIFRLSGSASTIRQVKERFNTQFDLDLFECDLKPDMHTVAGLFKTYLRELPNPIMGGSTYHHLNGLILQHGQQMAPSQLAMIFRDYFADPANVSKIHYDMCYVLFKFLNQVIANNKTNRMNLRNVCIVFVPTLNISIEVLTTFLVDFDCIFENGSPVPDDKREVLDLHIPNF